MSNNTHKQKNIIVELNLTPDQAEAFVHMLDVSCLALEEQVITVQGAIQKELTGVQTKDTDQRRLNLTNYLDGIVSQHALASTVLKAIQDKIAKGAKVTILV